MVSERLAFLPPTLTRWQPCAPAADRAVWQALPQTRRAPMVAAGARALQGEVPRLPLGLWLDFTRTGARAGWEAAYFTRRRMLASLAAAECVEYNGRYLDKTADLLWAICEESGWQLPAHNSYIRDTPQLPLPDVSRPVLDLFAAETGALLSMVCYLLGPELEQAAPGLCARVRAELDKRMITPYLTTHFWWMGQGDEPMCNWTSWCTQNVLLTAFLTVEDEAVLQRVVRQAATSLDCFLKDYAADGCCNEGAQYYRHAGLTLWGALDILATAAPDAFAPLFGTEKIRNIAEYICNMRAQGLYYFNFGDCSPLAGRCGAREYRFGLAVGSARLQALAAADFAADDDPDGLTAQDASCGINLWYRILTAFTAADLAAAATGGAPGEGTPATVYYPSTGIYTAHAGAFALGCKMGGNGDSHNHNDTGSFTVYKNGQPYLIDIGVESYTRKTFSPQRYEIWTMQSAWHNLPTFDGVMQQDGAAFAARQVVAGEREISGDLAGAYPPLPGLGFYKRRLCLDEHGVCLCDETDYRNPVTLSLMSRMAPTVDGGTLRLGTLGVVAMLGQSAVIVEAVPVSDPRLRTAWPGTIYRTLVTFTGKITLNMQ